MKRMNVTATGMGQGSFTRLLAADCCIDLIDSYISQSLVIFNSISPSTSF